MDPAILLIGCGKMGMALLNGWLNKNYKKSKIIVIETNNKICDLLKNKDISCYSSLNSYEQKHENLIVVFAVKPQALDEVLVKLNKIKIINEEYLSIVAGIKVEHISKYLGKTKSIYRAMPNIPAEVSEGMTAIFKNDNCINRYSFFIENLLNSVGKTVWVNSEKDIDIVTAISGSGPAYFFLLTECLIRIGYSLGLSRDLSEKLSIQTIIGSSELLKVSKKSPEILRNNVTSKGGTTEAALNILNNNNFEKILKEAVFAAKKKSEELSKD